MDFLPGFFQGITRVIVSYPFDHVRLYLQTNNLKTYTDFFKKNNIRYLYRGVSIPLATVPIERSIQFRLYEHLNKDYSPFTSGCVCGIVNITFSLPSTYICNNYILDKNNNSLFQYINKIYKNPVQLYNGIKPEIVRSTFATSVYLGTYGKMREKFGNDRFNTVINGTIAGWTTWTLTYPMETIKIEQQIYNKNIKNILIERISKYGILNLWKGISAVYLRTLPS